MRGLKGKVAIVTGSGRGIGAATARRLAAEGVSVVVADINDESARVTVEAIRADGGRAVSVHADVAVEDDLAGMVQAAVDEFGGVDILHNNATLSYDRHYVNDGGVMTIDPENWRLTFEVNVLGPALACKHAVPVMIERGGGAIINMSSGSAERGDFAITGYACMKAAVVTLTKYVATQFGKQGIRCNAVSPGATKTQGLAEAMDGSSLAMVETHTLTPYLGEPEDLAAAVVFLASDEARYVTGQTIAVNGGLTDHQPFFAEVVAGGHDSRLHE